MRNRGLRPRQGDAGRVCLLHSPGFAHGARGTPATSRTGAPAVSTTPGIRGLLGLSASSPAPRPGLCLNHPRHQRLVGTPGCTGSRPVRLGLNHPRHQRLVGTMVLSLASLLPSVSTTPGIRGLLGLRAAHSGRSAGGSQPPPASEACWDLRKCASSITRTSVSTKRREAGRFALGLGAGNSPNSSSRDRGLPCSAS